MEMKDPYNVRLYGIVSAEQYEKIIQNLNNELRPSRSKHTDKALLATGMLIVPLALWGVRHGRQTKRRKKLLNQFIKNFNDENPHLLMRWNRRPESFLSIEKRSDENGVIVEAIPAIVEARAEPVEAQQPRHFSSHEDSAAIEAPHAVV